MISNIRKALPAIKEDKNESHMVPPHESAGLANSSSNLKIFFFFNESCSLKLLPKITDSEFFFLKALELN